MFWTVRFHPREYEVASPSFTPRTSAIRAPTQVASNGGKWQARLSTVRHHLSARRKEGEPHWLGQEPKRMSQWHGMAVKCVLSRSLRCRMANMEESSSKQESRDRIMANRPSPDMAQNRPQRGRESLERPKVLRLMTSLSKSPRAWFEEESSG